METYILQLEIAVIENKGLINQFPKDLQDAACLTELLLQGKYQEVLKSNIVEWVFGKESERSLNDKFSQVIVDNIEKYVKDAFGTSRLIQEYGLLCVGISCLQLFVQNNWVGPPSTSPADSLMSIAHNVEKETALCTHSQEELSVDAEQVYSLANHHMYLLLSKTILLDCRKFLQNCQTSVWWLIRCLRTQQALFEERSPTLKNTILDLITEVLRKEPLMTNDNYRDAQIQFAVEAGHTCHFYYEPNLAKEHFTRAHKLSELEIELTGAMGRRTKFQTEDKAQLVLKVTRPGHFPEESSTATANEVSAVKPIELPKDVMLQDDTLLNEIKFTDNDEEFVTKLTPTEQSLILGLCYEHRRSHESISKIMQEESMAYIVSVLRHPQNWCVISTCTLLRTFWESESLRRSVRSLSQLEELVTQFDRPSENPAQRLHLLYSVQLPPRWGIQKEQANFLLKMGALKGALDVFLRLHMWEDVIKCYKNLGQTEKAEKVIREQLAVQETPSLWCHLGDVLEKPECYQKAWELSNCRYARAQRSLGYHYLYKAQFEEALPYFEKSLEINALQIGVWFSYGCACMGCSKWDEAAKAFRRCVTIDYDNFEAWNNLSTAYIRLNQKQKAFTALQEALKCEYENWRVWENYLLVSIDIGHFLEVIRSFHRLLDLKNKYSDSQVLKLLVRAVNENIKDAQNNPSFNHRPKVLELFGRLTSKVTNEAEIWSLYATLLTGGNDVTESDRERALQYLLKSLRCSTQTVGWEKDVEKCKSVAEESTALSRTYMEVVLKLDNPSQAVILLSSARLMLKGNLSKIKQKHTDQATKQLLDILREPCEQLEVQLQKVVDLIEELKGR